MILPTKHIRPDRALIGVGAEVLGLLVQPMTVSGLWDAIPIAAVCRDVEPGN